MTNIDAVEDDGKETDVWLADENPQPVPTEWLLLRHRPFMEMPKHWIREGRMSASYLPRQRLPSNNHLQSKSLIWMQSLEGQLLGILLIFALFIILFESLRCFWQKICRRPHQTRGNGRILLPGDEKQLRGVMEPDPEKIPQEDSC